MKWAGLTSLGANRLDQWPYFDSMRSFLVLGHRQRSSHNNTVLSLLPVDMQFEIRLFLDKISYTDFGAARWLGHSDSNRVISGLNPEYGRVVSSSEKEVQLSPKMVSRLEWKTLLLYAEIIVRNKVYIRSRQPMARVPHVVRGIILNGTVHYSTNLSIFEWMKIDKFVKDLIG
ncbi:hypothetical protein TNCV_1748111 [Trichonephila clavipes]|nr:hypothetical protein TNCV_1748111 [Trichonephila clavipes]